MQRTAKQCQGVSRLLNFLFPFLLSPVLEIARVKWRIITKAHGREGQSAHSRCDLCGVQYEFLASEVFGGCSPRGRPYRTAMTAGITRPADWQGPGRAHCSMQHHQTPDARLPAHHHHHRQRSLGRISARHHGQYLPLWHRPRGRLPAESVTNGPDRHRSSPGHLHQPDWTPPPTGPNPPA